MIFCKNCKAQMSDNDAFCVNCGTAVEQNPNAMPPMPLEEIPNIKMILPINRTGLAIVAGYMGLFSLLPFVGIVSIIIGVIAIIQLKKHPEKLGRGRAWFGIIMGVITTLFWLLIPIEFN